MSWINHYHHKNLGEFLTVPLYQLSQPANNDEHPDIPVGTLVLGDDSNAVLYTPAYRAERRVWDEVLRMMEDDPTSTILKEYIKLIQKVPRQSITPSFSWSGNMWWKATNEAIRQGYNPEGRTIVEHWVGMKLMENYPLALDEAVSLLRDIGE